LKIENNLHGGWWHNFVWSEDIRNEKPSWLKPWNPSSHFLHSVVAAWEEEEEEECWTSTYSGRRRVTTLNSSANRNVVVSPPSKSSTRSSISTKNGESVLSLSFSLHSNNVTNRIWHQCYLLCALFQVNSSWRISARKLTRSTRKSPNSSVYVSYFHFSMFFV